MPSMFRDLAFLFDTPLRAKALAYLLKRPGEEGDASEFAAVSGVTKAQAQKELNALVKFGVLKSRGVGKDKKYVADEQDPLFHALHNFLIVAAAPTDSEILSAFKGVRGIQLLAVAGALADDGRSSVDMLVVTKDPDNPKIARSVKKVENMAAMPVRYAVLELGEYIERKQAFDRMLRDIFEYSHRILLEKEG